ncbi:hypothetical protein F4678DRAFT_486826 [Xylaria arbuscula]|nr:hypothetical protein F4678DRAFT_486826 [Xylaria arbuscula]
MAPRRTLMAFLAIFINLAVSPSVAIAPHEWNGSSSIIPTLGQRDADQGEGKIECSRTDREYNIPLRIGLVFAMLATSFFGVALPIFLKPSLPARFQGCFTLLKQFGTGVVISTALIHLFSEASELFGNKCLGDLGFDATPAAIMLGGLFIAFLIEYITHRVARKYYNRTPNADDAINVMVLESGIIFHSLLVGLTLVVAEDTAFMPLFVAIVFHQVFEGIALGSRIATAGCTITDSEKMMQDVGSDGANWKPLSMARKLAMAAAFAFVTPVGMAIGIGVLHSFNDNDPTTVIAIGTLNALSAGILLWVGMIEMWAADWMFEGEFESANAKTTALGAIGLIAGMALMGLLGKWA